MSFEKTYISRIDNLLPSLPKWWALVVIIALSILGSSQQGFGQVVKSLKHDWQVLEPNTEYYIPVLAANGVKSNHYSLWLNARRYRGILQFPAPKGLSIYINNKLYRSYLSEQIAYINLNKIGQEFGYKNLWLTAYHPKGEVPMEYFMIVQRASPELLVSLKEEKKQAQVLPKAAMPLSGVTVLVLIFIAALYIFLKNFAPNQFFPLFQLNDLLSSDKEKYSSSSYRITSSFTLALQAINVISIAFCLNLALNLGSIPIFLEEFILIGEQQIGEFLLLVNFFLIGIIYLLVKFFTLYGAGILFNMRKLVFIHYYEFVRGSTLLSISILILAVLTFSTHLLSYSTYLILIQGIVITIFLMRSLKVLLLFKSEGSFRKVYLFSYLCATEIIPMFLIIRFVGDYQLHILVQ